MNALHNGAFVGDCFVKKNKAEAECWGEKNNRQKAPDEFCG